MSSVVVVVVVVAAVVAVSVVVMLVIVVDTPLQTVFLFLGRGRPDRTGQGAQRGGSRQ